MRRPLVLGSRNAEALDALSSNLINTAAPVAHDTATPALEARRGNTARIGRHRVPASGRRQAPASLQGCKRSQPAASCNGRAAAVAIHARAGGGPILLFMEPVLLHLLTEVSAAVMETLRLNRAAAS